MKYTDVKPSHWAYNAIEQFASKDNVSLNYSYAIKDYNTSNDSMVANFGINENGFSTNPLVYSFVANEALSQFEIPDYYIDPNDYTEGLLDLNVTVDGVDTGFSFSNGGVPSGSIALSTNHANVAFDSCIVIDVSSEQQIFLDNFSDSNINDNIWKLEGDGCTAEIEDFKLKFTSSGGGYLVMKDINWSDIKVISKIYFLSGSISSDPNNPTLAAVSVRFTSHNCRYALILNATTNEIYITKYSYGKLTEYTRHSITLTNDDHIMIALAVSGSQLIAQTSAEYRNDLETIHTQIDSNVNFKLSRGVSKDSTVKVICSGKPLLNSYGLSENTSMESVKLPTYDLPIVREIFGYVYENNGNILPETAYYNGRQLTRVPLSEDLFEDPSISGNTKSIVSYLQLFFVYTLGGATYQTSYHPGQPLPQPYPYVHKKTVSATTYEFTYNSKTVYITIEYLDDTHAKITFDCMTDPLGDTKLYICDVRSTIQDKWIVTDMKRTSDRTFILILSDLTSDFGYISLPDPSTEEKETINMNYLKSKVILPSQTFKYCYAISSYGRFYSHYLLNQEQIELKYYIQQHYQTTVTSQYLGTVTPSSSNMYYTNWFLPDGKLTRAQLLTWVNNVRINILGRYSTVFYDGIKTTEFAKYTNNINRYSYTGNIPPWWWDSVRDLESLQYTDDSGNLQYVLYYDSDIESHIDEIVKRKEMVKIFNGLRKHLEEVLL